MLDYERELLGRSNTYQQFLKDEATSHRDYLESFYNKVLAGAGIVGAIFVFFNFQNLKTIKEELTAKFNAEITKLMQEKQVEFDRERQAALAEFRTSLDTNKADADRKVAALHAHIEAKITETNQTSAQDFYLVVEYASVMSRAAVILSAEPTEDSEKNTARNKERQDVIERMERLQPRVTRHRTFNIFLARLYRSLRNYGKAVEVLTKVIDIWDDQRADYSLTDKENQAALLYNRACYHVRLAEERKKVPARQDPAQDAEFRARTAEHLDKARADLRACVLLSEKERDEIQNDPDHDFDALFDDPSHPDWSWL